MKHKPLWARKKQRQLTDFHKQENKIANYVDKHKQPLARDEIPTPKTPNSSRSHELKPKLVFAHNIGWKFPLKPRCKIPFTTGLKETKLTNNSQFILESKKAFIKQTTRNLFIWPKQFTAPAKAGNAQALLQKSRYAAIAIANRLQKRYTGLQVFRPLGKPLSQEFAVKDAFAEKVEFTFKASNGVKIDKSVHVDESGHRHKGAEIEFPTPEQADDYCNLPDDFRRMAGLFSSSLAAYNTNIVKHLAAIEDIRTTMRDMRATMRPKRNRLFRRALKRSATVSGVS